MSADSPQSPRDTVRESLVIIASILIAFALDAGWDTLNERRLERELLADLAEEIRDNIALLDRVVSVKSARLERVDQIIREAGPNREGLSAGTLKTLLASIVATQTFEPQTGVLDLLLQSGNQALLRNSTLRTRLYGLPASMSHYRENQDIVLNFTKCT